MSVLRYSMLLQWSDEDHAYLVRLPEWEDRVHGPVTHGETYEEALMRGKDALDALIASAQKHGEPLPAPHTYSGADRAG
jgi:predicted RNase H-like HicB family nuclease